MKIIKVLLLCLIGTIVGGYLFANLASIFFDIPVKEEVDNIVNLVVWVYGFIFGAIVGAISGLVLGLKLVVHPKK